MPEYVIISLLQKDSPTTFHKSKWPLHMTIIRPFASSKNVKDIIDTLKIFCSNKKVIKTKGKSYEMFGPDKNIPVTELENTTETKSLHDDILHICSSWLEFKKPTYDIYRPHVTDQGNQKISIGESVVIETISLVEMIGEDRRIMGTIKLHT